jgi:alkylation response protein AidB-like acyl-CoA dehydrogenase
VINGSKTYITNGQNADLVIVVAKTDPDKGAKGTSLILVEAGTEGFTKGPQPGQDRPEQRRHLRAVLPGRARAHHQLPGRRERGFVYLMSQLPQERLGIAISAMGGAQRAFDEAVAFVKGRNAFGKPIFDFQNTRFVLADLRAKLQVGWAHLDVCLQKHMEGKLTAFEGAAAKLWHTELQWEVCDAALQLHGGAGI